MNIDFKKYERIFAFGCSFTSYSWPTWADIIAFQNSHAKYYNYGMPGLGNLGISCRITEANKRYNFGKKDLIMVMWSTFCREDRWFDNGWKAYGNVFNSPFPDEYIENFCDPIGLLIRDHAIINQTNSYMNKLNSGYIALKSTPFNFTERPIDENNQLLLTLNKLYAEEYNQMPLELYAFMGYDWGICKQHFFDDLAEEPTMRHDCHPFTSLYAEYLEEIGFDLDDKTMDFAKNADSILNSCKTRTEINNQFDYLNSKLQSRDKQNLI